MATRMHPLTGEVISYAKADRVRQELFSMRTDAQPQRVQRARQSYDGASSSTEHSRYWANADSKDADTANSRAVRAKLTARSRYEVGSNPYYAGIVSTHCNMLVGVGPTLRMLTGNREFNQLVEREFYKWCQSVHFRRKLWCMAHARTGDGETFAILQTNPNIRGRVQLDLVVIEAEQCQTPILPYDDPTYADGMKLDENQNPIWYDILPAHPASSYSEVNAPVRVPARDVLHWFKLRRAGSHRGIPDLTSSLNVGAASRRFREATVAKAETQADFTLFLKTQYQPDQLDSVASMSTFDIEKRMMTALPNNVEPFQLSSDSPNAQYNDFNRAQVSEQARPLSMPYNAAACDSSTYSFASGKLDTLCYRAALNVEREDCNDLVLDPLFSAWFGEWVITSGRRDIIPNHQWDWPTHPVIDAVQEANAVDTKLKNSTITLRQAFSDQGQDLEDQLSIMAEDMFGELTDETVEKARNIVTLKNTPAHAIQYVAQILGLQTPGLPTSEPEPAIEEEDEPVETT